MSKKNVIICFDPGNDLTGWCVYSVEDKVLFYKNKEDNLKVIEKFKEFFQKYNILQVGIEYPSSYGMSVGQSLYDTCTFVGILIQISKDNNINPELVFRKSVKMFLCNSVRAKDAEVNLRVREYFGEDNTIKSPNVFYWNEEVEKNGGNKWCNNDQYASIAVLCYLIYPHDILIKNEKEQERNKISQQLQEYLR
jgi:hypothetical protein